MIHAITRLLNTFTFIYIPCNNYGSLNTTTKPVNYNNSFWQSFQGFKRLPLICQHLKKDIKMFLSFSPQLVEESYVSGIAKKLIPPKYRSAAQKAAGLALVMFKSMYHNRQKSVIILYLGLFLKQVQILKRNSLAQVMVTKIRQKWEFFLFITNQVGYSKPLQILASLYL